MSMDWTPRCPASRSLRTSGHDQFGRRSDAQVGRRDPIRGARATPCDTERDDPTRLQGEVQLGGSAAAPMRGGPQPGARPFFPSRSPGAQPRYTAGSRARAPDAPVAGSTACRADPGRTDSLLQPVTRRPPWDACREPCDGLGVAFLGSIFALFGRFAGRLLNSTLGWATILLFGKVSGRHQTILLGIAFGSLLWVLTLVGILLPAVGTVLLTFMPLPDFVDEAVVRLIMLALALLVPLVIGVAAIAITEASRRPRGSGLVVGLLRGYPFTFALPSRSASSPSRQSFGRLEAWRSDGLTRTCPWSSSGAGTTRSSTMSKPSWTGRASTSRRDQRRASCRCRPGCSTPWPAMPSVASSRTA